MLQLTPADVWKGAAAAVGAAATLAVAGFGVGLKFQEGLSNTKTAEFKAETGVAQTKLTSAQEKIALLLEANEKSRQTNSQLADMLNARNEQIQKLSVQVGAVNNCAFIHQQINSLENELRHVGSVNLFAPGSNAKQDAEDEARREALEQRIARYQAQLGPGACR